jgi:hypothetical protein
MRSFIAAIVIAATAPATVPAGWIKAGSAPDDYEVGTRPAPEIGKRNAAYMRSLSSIAQNKQDPFGTLMQVCSAKSFIGKRVRFRAKVKTQDAKDWAGLWLRVDGAPGRPSLAFDNMGDRPIKGTTGWKTYDVVLDVSPNASRLAYGVLISGAGEVAMADVSLESVSDDVPLTGDRNLDLPRNLDLELPTPAPSR